MQEKLIETGDQMIEDLFADIADDAQNQIKAAPAQPMIRIVHFDDSDKPAGSETRPLRSFL